MAVKMSEISENVFYIALQYLKANVDLTGIYKHVMATSMEFALMCCMSSLEPRALSPEARASNW